MNEDHLNGVKAQLLASGFCVVPAVIAADDVAAIKRRLAFIAEHAAFYAAFGVYFTPPAPAGSVDTGDPLQRFEQIGNVPFLDAVCRKHLLMHPSFLRVAAALLGPDFNIINAGFFLKPAYHGAEVPWHQDAASWGVPSTAWTPVDAPLIFDYWLALDPTDEDNGCLELLPESHRRGILPHARRGGLLPEADPAAFGFDPARRVCIAAEPGDLVLYHQDMFHRSSPNRSARARLAAAGTLIATRDVPRMRALLPELVTLEHWPVSRRGQLVKPPQSLPEHPTRWGLLRQRVARHLTTRFRRSLASVSPDFTG